MKRIHMHVVVESLPAAIRFYSGLFATPPCCGGTRYANWRVDEPPLNLEASVTDRPIGLAHFGLEVETPADLPAIDRVLQGAHRARGSVPCEVSVRKQDIRKESKL
jgi:hypothetical protein